MYEGDLIGRGGMNREWEGPVPAVAFVARVSLQMLRHVFLGSANAGLMTDASQAFALAKFVSTLFLATHPSLTKRSRHSEGIRKREKR
jgi:hypothetical protein